MKIPPNKKRRNIRSKIDFYHLYFKRSGFYSFIYKNIFKLILGLGAIFLLIYFTQSYLPDFEELLNVLFQKLNKFLVLTIFFVSESFLGLIPPDFFIAWSNSFPQPYEMVTLLAILSYCGGVVSYFIGKGLGKIPKVEAYILKKFIKHFDLVKKWGGFMIIFAAVFPLPFSIVCIAAGMVRYPFVPFLLFAIFRFARFYFYAILIFHALTI